MESASKDSGEIVSELPTRPRKASPKVKAPRVMVWADQDSARLRKDGFSCPALSLKPEESWELEDQSIR